MKIAILLCFSVGSFVLVECLGAQAAVITRAPYNPSKTGTPPSRREGQRPQSYTQPQNNGTTKRTKPSAPYDANPSANQRAARRNTSQQHNPANVKLQNLPSSPRRNGRVINQRPNARQRLPAGISGGGISTRQIPGIPAGPPDTGIDDKVVIGVDVTTIPTVIPPIDISPTAPPQITTEPITEPPTTEPPTTEPPTTEPPITDPPVTEPPITRPPFTIPSQTTTTIAPQTTTTIAPQTTTTIAPQTTTTIRPQTTSTIAPQTTTTIAPQTTTTIAPQTTTTIAPQTTTTIKPQTPPPPPPCVPIPPQKSSVVYVPRPVVHYGYFRQPPPVKQPPPVVVVNNEISPGKPCPATGAQAAALPAEPAVQSYGPNMIVINNPKGAPPIPPMVYNKGQPPQILGK